MKVVILGCSGNCVDILDAMLTANQQAEQEIYQPLGFLDDRPSTDQLQGFPVLGPLKLAEQLDDAYFITAIGSSASYRNKPALLSLPRQRYVTVIHPSASVSRWARLGAGCAILQQVTIANNAELGDHVVVLPASVISHDARVDSYSILAGGVIVSGFVHVQENCYLGAGATIRERLVIGARTLVGMGSVVVKNVPPDSKIMGNPARP